ncbi:MAG: hypothetical protein JWO30_1897 [Fibrobacteres bacterium]|nr:hypothetical protein [Fibrobacterota bacterium]
MIGEQEVDWGQGPPGLTTFAAGSVYEESRRGSHQYVGVPDPNGLLG